MIDGFNTFSLIANNTKCQTRKNLPNLLEQQLKDFPNHKLPIYRFDFGDERINFDITRIIYFYIEKNLFVQNDK